MRLPGGIKASIGHPRVLRWTTTLVVLAAGWIWLRSGESRYIARPGVALAAPVLDRASRVNAPAFLGMTSDPAAVRTPARRYRLVNAFPHLTFQNPLQLLPVPRSSRLCVIGREGTVEMLSGAAEVATKSLVLDIRDHCQGWDDSGLLGIAFHPEFGKPGSANRGYFYIWYNHCETPTAGPGRPPHRMLTRDRLVRYTIPDGQESADPASALILIDQQDRDLYHSGGGMFFGPDGFLYLGLGDEGMSRDFFDNAQHVDKSLFAGMIRIDVDEDARRSHPIPRQPVGGATAHYMIPNDNPWVGRPNTLEEFWCIGLRNPHRVTYDEPTGTMWCGDIGQEAWEELDLLKKGGNYQWAFLEGTHPGYKPEPSAEELLGTQESPLYEYEHTEDRCIIGGYVYRGSRFPEFAGQYIFGDNGSGRIWAMSEWETGKPKLAEIARMPGRAYTGLSGFGHDAAGELYMCQMGARDGAIFHLLTDAAPDGPALPEVLSKTGAFSDTAALTPAPQLLAYDVNVPFWSDGANKRRWIALPGEAPFDKPTERIGFSADEAFKFPVGTVFVKHFDLSLDETRPELARRLETRVLMRGKSGGVYGATYRWRPDGRDADRVDEEATEDVTVATAEPVGPLANADLGAVTTAGTFSAVERGADLSAVEPTGGGDATVDGLSFASVESAGDFDLRVRVQSLKGRKGRATAGLMFRQSNDAGSPMFGLFVRADANDAARSELLFVQRQAMNTAMSETVLGTVASRGDVWLRLQRRDQFTIAALGSNDGVNWKQLAPPWRAFYRSNGRVGLSVAGGRAAFRDLARMRRQSWYFPSSYDCLSCHNANAGMILGVNARQLNRDFANPITGAAGNQLMNWWRAGMFSSDVRAEQVAASPRLTSLTDAHASALDRARSYLDVNCAYCHRSSGAGGYFDASFSTPFEKQNLLTDQLRNPLGMSGVRVVAPGDPRKSMLLRRIQSLNPAERMPPLGRNRVDAENAKMVETWIAGMSAR